MQNQSQTLLQILYRHEKGALVSIERAFAGIKMMPEVRAVYEQKRAAVAVIERKLGKGKGAP